ncbi:hypothetical protein Hamer_G023311 [Homarus americanus]|uniref:Uncharacterized protein n=1 Tax=Homarus americanus TaxID=6706 RepID=A0A8J5N6G4_HOMAM|nr:hypothetical protein Hamer_G023311 [Homarus americanus]
MKFQVLACVLSLAGLSMAGVLSFDQVSPPGAGSFGEKITAGATPSVLPSPAESSTAGVVGIIETIEKFLPFVKMLVKMLPKIDVPVYNPQQLNTPTFNNPFIPNYKSPKINIQ